MLNSHLAWQQLIATEEKLSLLDMPYMSSVYYSLPDPIPELSFIYVIYLFPVGI